MSVPGADELLLGIGNAAEGDRSTRVTGWQDGRHLAEGAAYGVK